MGPMQEEFVTADPEEAHAFMRAVYTENTMRITGSRDGFLMRHTVAGAGGLSVAVMTHTMAVEHVAQPLGYPLAVRVLRGKIERETGGETVRAGLGDVFLAAQPDRPYTVRWDDVGLQLIRARPAGCGSPAWCPSHRPVPGTWPRPWTSSPAGCWPAPRRWPARC